MQNPESTGLSLKVKIIILITLLIICVIGVILYFYHLTDRYSAKIYDNTKSVENIFITNQETFEKVAYLLKDSDLYDYLYSIDKKAIFNTSIPKKEKFFTKKEYTFLCDFLNEYRPYEIGKRNGDLYFVFLCQENDATLYYTEREDKSLFDLLNVLGQDSEVEMIRDKWCFRVQPSEVVRK